MNKLSRSAAHLLFAVFFFGWITYPGWWNEWYSVYPEGYAHPASMSNQYDPHWGFWYW